MRVLILNWRCPINPRAGGAEHLTYEVAKRLVAVGNEVEWFSATFPGAKTEEILDGVRIVRAGRQWTVHLHAFLRYFRRLRTRFDLVIDEVNTIPFFTPLWADIPAFMLIYQLAREVWWHETPFPISLLGFMLESQYLRLYKRAPVLTESWSTEGDLRALGFRGPITVIPVGIEPIDDALAAKGSMPTFLYVGRLSPSKRVTDVVKAFSLFRRRSSGTLWIVGDGSVPYTRSLLRLVSRLGLAPDVQFFGRISNERKYNLMARAHALLLASAREGWGLVVTEANACGTLAIAYDVPGLRDSIRNNDTGFLVRPTPKALADAMVFVWSHPTLCEAISQKARSWSQSFSYEVTVDAVVREITRASTVQDLPGKQPARAPKGVRS